MTRFKQSLSIKIIGILLVFFVVALSAIGLTLSISWQLEGAAAAINDAGSLRMRAYRIAHHLTRSAAITSDPQRYAAFLQTELTEFENILGKLVSGDPGRPLFIPRDSEIPEDVATLSKYWHLELGPLLRSIARQPDRIMRQNEFTKFDMVVVPFVDGINRVVLKMEHSYARNTNILRLSQVSLIGLAIIGTLILIRFFFVLVIRPVGLLSEGIHRMEREDFGVRVPVLKQDEFGDLSEGFNHMAEHLQALYETLEERVAAKTRDLTEKNRELEILYAISGLLHEPGDADTLCRGFLRRTQTMLGASASSVRLLDSGAKSLCITVGEGLDDAFMDSEAVLACGDCMCGAAVERNLTFFTETDTPNPEMTRETCRRAGYRTVAAATIPVDKRPIGVYNLYFKEPRSFSESDRKLLEALGQQLGTALDKQRLQARERDLAVSEERNLLARELHDSIAQGLAFLNLQVQMLDSALQRNDNAEMQETLERIRLGVQESYDDVRELLVHFRTRIDQQDLDEAIEAALRRLAEQTSVATHFEVQGDGAALDPEAETQLLYIVQEALSNVRKHAQARSVRVRLRRSLDGLSVSVQDDGIGFDESADSRTDESDHIGLQIMRERALRVGGRIMVRSSRGRGTEVKLDLPRRQEESH
ncbi:MAG: type IV pili methyl-accepting chemotaxis transducer N-terminal domain-containing protein [Rhodocyclaceae bacterium]|nr:type IV pili methyl-accepting chemotaxis transducer N-terminal domain-containing protein [Rhodocyclaceae bacterium]